VGAHPNFRRSRRAAAAMNSIADDFIKDCIITIVSDDYESFEIIMKDIKPLMDAKGMEASEAEVAAPRNGHY